MTLSELIEPGSPTPPAPSATTGRRHNRWVEWVLPILNAVVFIGKRLLFAAIVVLFIIFLTYLGLAMARGESLAPAASTAASDSIAYLSRLANGDLGMTTTAGSTLKPRPVSEVLLELLPRSLGLLGAALLFAAVIGVSLGLAAARSRARNSLGILVATLVGVSIPSFFAAFLLQWLVTEATQAAGRQVLPVGGFGWDQHIILPMLVLAARPIAQITRITFVTVREVYAQDYIRTAYSKGLHRYAIMTVHALRNAMIPILTTIGVSLRFSLSSLPVVEFYFGWPGAGNTLLKSIANQDPNITVALTISLGLLFILVNMLLELSYRLIDPRLAKKADHILGGERIGLLGLLRQMGDGLVELIRNNPLARWLQRRRGELEQVEMIHPDDLANGLANGLEQGNGSGRRSIAKSFLGNFPLAAGSVLVLGLLLLIFIGPYLAPNNPYSTQGLVKIDGKLTPPPFAPGETYPWGTDALGRDIMSLILAGAQQTLVLGLFIVAARTLVGIGLGAIAGWFEGSLADRLILGLTEVIAAFPTLLVGMILILALGIRQGMPPFIIALGFVGWGEIMQFVRSEVIATRPKLFIESAFAVGAGIPRIIVRHIMPNLFSALVSIVALEMGAVMMLLGELGFIGIFIGGGSLIALPSMTVHYSDIPEWGALLSNIRYQARAYPWTGLYPMLGFFIAILSFNLFGEGIRRMLEEGNLVLNRLFNRYTLALAAVLVVGFNWYQANSGAVPFYRTRAAEFDGQRALSHIALLTDPRMYGRALGTPGTDLAALYIAREFKQYGLQSAGQASTYFQTRKHAYEQLETTPILAIDDGGPALAYQRDFAAFPGRNMTQGEGYAPVRVILLGEAAPPGAPGFRTAFVELDRADFSGEILLTFSEREARILTYNHKDGMLVVTDDPELLKRRFTLSGRSGSVMNIFTGESRGSETPYIWISEATAERILSGSGYTLNDIRRQYAELAVEQVFQLPLETKVYIKVDGSLVQDFPVKHIIGYIPGTMGMDRCTTCLGKNLIVVLAQYDSPPIGPEGFYPATNDNASGVAVMLEAARVLQESDYQPYKSFLFIAYSGEGLDGGEYVKDPDITKFLQARTGFTNFDLEAIIHLRGVGGGSGDRIEVSAGGSLRLAQLIERTAQQTGGRAQRAQESIDISLIYDEGSTFTQGGQDAPVLRLHWQGWEDYAGLPSDTLEIVSAANLEELGEALSMALMTIGRETQY